MGYYDPESKRRKVFWFKPITADGHEAEVLQHTLNLFEPLFSQYPEFYFNELFSGLSMPIQLS
jgi:hypothetical protein